MKYKIDIAITILFIVQAILYHNNYTIFYANLILAFISACTREIKIHIDGVGNDY